MASRPSQLAFSFNGGKDSTAVLRLLLQGVREWKQARGEPWSADDGLAGIHTFFFLGKDEFQEVQDFAEESDREYNLSMHTYTCGFKEGLREMVEQRSIKAVFLGTRHGDPNCKDQVKFPNFQHARISLRAAVALAHDTQHTGRAQDHCFTPVYAVPLPESTVPASRCGLRHSVRSQYHAVVSLTCLQSLQDFFCPSSRGWPPFMRVNPVLNWAYSDVWAYLRAVEAKFCHLYLEGYTSLGTTRDTAPNSALRRSDGSYAPAYTLNGTPCLTASTPSASPLFLQSNWPMASARRA